MISAAWFGLAAANAVLALIPSKIETKWSAPWCSICQGILAGLFVFAGFVSR